VEKACAVLGKAVWKSGTESSVHMHRSALGHLTMVASWLCSSEQTDSAVPVDQNPAFNRAKLQRAFSFNSWQYNIQTSPPHFPW